MLVRQIMSVEPWCCRPNDTLGEAARLMWERDCGVVPVVDDARRVVGVVTDRDALMAAYTQGRTLAEIPVSVAMSACVVTCHPDDLIERAGARMRHYRIRRIVVVDAEGRIAGMVSLKDLVDNGAPRLEIAETLAAICRPAHHSWAAE